MSAQPPLFPASELVSDAKRQGGGIHGEHQGATRGGTRSLAGSVREAGQDLPPREREARMIWSEERKELVG